MARLNETTAPAAALGARVVNSEDQPSAETLEAGEQQQRAAAMRTKPRHNAQNPPADYEEVKRSLMRQNRNLARSHSAQSLQIRTLGTQISSLLASNTALKEENIRLRKDLSNAQDNALKSGIDNLKDALNARLRDMAALVNNLDNHAVHTLSPQASPETRKSVCLESMQFRDRPSLREIMSETQMAVIMEVPASEEDVPRLSNVSMGSPDLGPPPVAHLEYESGDEPTKSTVPVDEPATNLANVDARRKRKESVGSNHARRRSTLVAPLLELEKTPSSLKAGAKRKVSDRDRGDAAVDGDDAFQFSRKSSFEEAKTKRAALVTTHDETSTLIKRPARKVLGDKSTNFSPKKARVEDKENVGKPEQKPSRDTSRRSSRQSRVPIPALHDVEMVPVRETEPSTAVHEIDLFPKTPAALQVLSPVSSEPASRGVGKADTPPPSDLSIASSTASTDGARPSRRARASVNYAEPSLVAKMRRPGKEMLDALSGLQDPRNVMSSSKKVLEDSLASSLFKSDTISTDSKAQNRRSPLNRTPEDEVVEELDLSPVDERETLSFPALMAVSKNTADFKSTVTAQDLDIFDFNDTTPPGSPEHQVDSGPKGRRHSSKTSDRGPKSSEAVSGRSSKVVRRKSMMV